MKRKDYFKDVSIILTIFPIFGVATLLTMTDVSTPWRVISAIFCFGIPIGITIYGFLKYKK
jgi:hypothetical protein